eukprot:scaffold3282_cov198-Alexandrium_tamarense.AAC.26
MLENAKHRQYFDAEAMSISSEVVVACICQLALTHGVLGPFQNELPFCCCMLRQQYLNFLDTSLESVDKNLI